jgi:hypothetical protein
VYYYKEGVENMAIYDILYEIKDERTANGIAKFNGYLEDYLSMIEDDETKKDIHALFTPLFMKNEELRICVDLKLGINKDAIANQIIRYKDSFKLPRGSITCPYLIYGNFQESQKAVIFVPGNKEEYVMAKALYYVISEPENEYEGTRNEVIATSISNENKDIVMDGIDQFFYKNEKAGIVQRSLDGRLFIDYEEMYDIAQTMASYQLVNLKDILAQSDNAQTTINQIIATWFLLKKFSYVQYMMDKNNLNRVHEGNVKRQRQAAKEKCDAIGFVSYSELWKLVKDLKVSK